MAAQLIFPNAAEWEGDAGGSGFIALRDAAENLLAPADGAPVGATQGGLLLAGRNEDNARHLRVDRLGGMAVALHSALLHEPFESATIHPTRWSAASTTFVPAQTALGWSANPTTLTTANAVTVLTSRAQVPKLQRIPLQFRARARTNRVANAQQEFGFGAPAGTALAANGAYFRVGNDTLQAVVVFNGVENAANITTSLGTDIPAWDTSFFTFDIVIDDEEARFFVQNSATGLVVYDKRVQLPLTSNRLWAVSHLPVFARCFNGAVAPSTAPVLVVSDLMVTQLDAHQGLSAGALAALNELGGDKNPLTGAQAQQQANNTEPTSAALSNTVAGYGVGILGGRFQFAAVAGAATDYQLFHFQVPAPYAFVLEGIDIDTWNIGAAVATTPHLLEWTLGLNGTAAGALTTHVRQFVGAQGMAIATPIGGLASPAISKVFSTPKVVQPGLFLAVILRMPTATATPSQVIAGNVTLHGHFR
jgi:hypothetical protein